MYVYAILVPCSWTARSDGDVWIRILSWLWAFRDCLDTSRDRRCLDKKISTVALQGHKLFFRIVRTDSIGVAVASGFHSAQAHISLSDKVSGNDVFMRGDATEIQ